jgi:hypothetical protein
MNQKLVERVVAGLLLSIAVGMAIHTPVTLWLGVLAPDWALVIKAWKEVLMGVALVLLFVVAVQRKQLGTLLSDRLLQLSLIYAGLHFVMMMVFQNGLQAAGAGLLIDLRFVLYFVLVYVFLTLYPSWRRAFIGAFGVGAVIILGFAVLQITVLPKDFLVHLGYSKATIAPYLTVDDNPALIRINSTLRGPNPLGAYAVIVLGMVSAAMLRWKLQTRRSWWIIGGFTLGAVVALGASYSRSSLIAAVVTLTVVVVAAVGPTVRRRLLITSGASLLIIGALVVTFRDSYIVSNVIFHDNPSTGAAVDSNTGHVDSLADGFSRMLRQPFGAGVGSTGSASLVGDNPLIIENQYLLVAHEVGWVGLVLFAWLFIEVLRRLWTRRQSALALGVFASGIGLAIIGLLLPVWTDDTVSITWWGLAAVAVASNVVSKTTYKKARKKHGA